MSDERKREEPSPPEPPRQTIRDELVERIGADYNSRANAAFIEALWNAAPALLVAARRSLEQDERIRDDVEFLGAVLRDWWVRHVPSNEHTRAQFDAVTLSLARLLDEKETPNAG